jgi:hypothetical protein
MTAAEAAKIGSARGRARRAPLIRTRRESGGAISPTASSPRPCSSCAITHRASRHRRSPPLRHGDEARTGKRPRYPTFRRYRNFHWVPGPVRVLEVRERVANLAGRETGSDTVECNGINGEKHDDTFRLGLRRGTAGLEGCLVEMSRAFFGRDNPSRSKRRRSTCCGRRPELPPLTANVTRWPGASRSAGKSTSHCRARSTQTCTVRPAQGGCPGHDIAIAESCERRRHRTCEHGARLPRE